LDISPTDILAPLNENQRLAASHIDGPLMILAGPGSGKTRVVTHRIAYMVASGVSPYQIAALTFTNKSAGEMKERLNRLLPGTFVWTGTFHRFCSKLLRTYAPQVGLRENFTIYDTKDSRTLLKQAVDHASVDLIQYTVEEVGEQISRAKSKALTSEMFAQQRGGPLQAVTARVYPVYQELLRKANACDFDDLLLHVVQLFRESEELRMALDDRFRYLLVDEYQDTNIVQYTIIRALSMNHPNIAVTGDPDQSIYGWRGADLNNILNFERDFPGTKVVRLEENYRSTKNILLVADQLITNNLRRKAKTLYTANPDGEPSRLIAYPSGHDEARAIADEIQYGIQSKKFRGQDVAILYRTNWLSRNIEMTLRNNGIRYQIINGLEFYQRKEIKDLLGYLRLMNNPSDNVSFERIVNVPSRKIGKVTVGKIRAYAAKHNLSMLETAREISGNNGLSAAVAKKVRQFVQLFDRLMVDASARVEDILIKIISATEYRRYLQENFEDGQEREDNIDELISAAQEFDQDFAEESNLELFLENTALVNDTDAMDDQDVVTLMTIHAAKGLEYPIIYVIGAEEGLLPHERSISNEDEIEEERRLLFVAITRAKQQLQISRAMSRPRRGGYSFTIASRFLMELPRDKMHVVEPRSYISDRERMDFVADDNSDQWPEETTYLDTGEEEYSSGSSKRSSETLYDEMARKTEDPSSWLESKIMTASNMQSPSAAWQQFEVGTMVTHPEYGIGVIESISGNARKRTASVNFELVGHKQFRLAHSNLQITSEPI
jgi:DNA helicase II / ATP-dependent DNA helicase PcrA